ncbi:hypothetical protein HK105_205670 [Polyrhizophydium stewartii]|uniref:Uncharacterized protein n=1 Tax=Polyrhizophydium stewartii TaxID=2732419 RepID=A0ABR4N5H6_9FUNG
MLHPPPANKRDKTQLDPMVAAPAQALRTLMLSLSHELESLRRQLHEQHAAGEALRADLAAQTEANTALVGDTDALHSMLADLEAEAQAQREDIARMQAAVESHDAAGAELQAQVTSIEAQLQALRDSLVSVSLAAQPTAAPPAAEPPVAEPPATPACAAIVMPPMRLNADAASLWDRLPNRVQSKIIDLAGDLTKIANGLMHPFEIKMMQERRRVAIWIDAMECDWQDDLRSLPTPPEGHFEHAIRTRSMFVRLLELFHVMGPCLYAAALSSHWEGAVTPCKLGGTEYAAAMSGRIDFLRNLIETGKVAHFDFYSIALGLVSGNVGAFNWLVKNTRRKFPNFEIPAILLDPSMHELLSDPPSCFIVISVRAKALICSASDFTNKAPLYHYVADPVVLEILFRRFGSTIDFPALNIEFHNVQILEWAHSRGLTRDKDKVAVSITQSAETAKVAQWACKHLGVVFEQEHLALACGDNNSAMTKWLLRQPGIIIDFHVIYKATGCFSLDCIDALIAHDPSVASKIVNAAAAISKAAIEMIKHRGVRVTPQELFEWLHERHPSGFTRIVLPSAIGFALQDGTHEVVAFLLKNVTTVDWDLVEARQMVEDSDAPRKFKKKLRLLIDRYNKRDKTLPDPMVAAPAQALHALVLSLSHGLESLRRQLHEQHAAGEALRADLAAQSDANTALLGDTDALRSMLADLEAEAQAQREAIARMRAAVESHDAAGAELQARVTSIEAQLHALRDSLASVSLAARPDTASVAAEPPAAAACAAIVMPPMRFNADAASLWDRLPDDLQSKIIDLAGDLTKLANGLLHPFEIKMMHESRRVAIWLEAMECDWQGDLRSLPNLPLGFFEHAIRTRSMLVRLLELEDAFISSLCTVAFRNHWEDALTPTQLFGHEYAAAVTGRIDILRNLIEAGKVIRFDANSIAHALAGGNLETFNWIVKNTRRKYPSFKIPAILLDPSIHELLSDPSSCFVVISARARALICSASDYTNDALLYQYAADHVALEILFRRFGSTIDFAALNIELHNVQILEWAHSRGLTRDKDKVAVSITQSAETAKVAQWACKHLGVVFEQEHLAFSCGNNNSAMTKWLLRQPGIIIDFHVIYKATGCFSLDCIDALIAHDPSVANKIVHAATTICKAAIEMIKHRGIGVTLQELFEWLHARHPSCFTPDALLPAIVFALENEMHEVVAFLLKNVTTVDWDLVEARQMVEESNASRKFKKKLRLLIDRCAARRAPSL